MSQDPASKADALRRLKQGIDSDAKKITQAISKSVEVGPALKRILEDHQAEIRDLAKQKKLEDEQLFTEWGLAGRRLPPKDIEDWIHLGLVVGMSRDEVLEATSLKCIEDAAFAFVEREELRAKIAGRLPATPVRDLLEQPAAAEMSAADWVKFDATLPDRDTQTGNWIHGIEDNQDFFPLAFSVMKKYARDQSKASIHPDDDRGFFVWEKLKIRWIKKTASVGDFYWNKEDCDLAKRQKTKKKRRRK